MIQPAIARAVDRHSLDQVAAREAMDEILAGRATAAQIAGLAVALRMKGETPDEIAGMAEAMRERVAPIRTRRTKLLDTCGTGGDNAGTFNVSTTVAITTAACGVAVAKHGNRAISSRAGSADVLEQLGVKIDLTPEGAARSIDVAGIAFLFAPHYHVALSHAAGPRRELGIRTVFNVLGRSPIPRAPSASSWASTAITWCGPPPKCWRGSEASARGWCTGATGSTS